jgi:aspartyl-tRNA(Asn)/glutamyl-tRNA(Gln) amidotransferase subunit C
MLQREEFEKLQELARLRLTDEEATELRRQLERILEYVRALQELKLDGVPPWGQGRVRGTPLRPDEAGPASSPEAFVSSAPDSRGDLFRVPRVLPGEKP